MSTKNSEIYAIEYSCNGKMLTFSKPLVMAIVNLTPDSFYDGGKYDSVNDVLRDAEDKIKQGADIIDLGGASSRPNALQVSEQEEWQRLERVLPALRKHFPSVFISVDTFRASVARKAADNGADMINDISGGLLDEGMFETIASLDLPYILMHMDGTPQTMQQNAPYMDVVNEVKERLLKRVSELQAYKFNKIILDPGFGFGKSLANNYQLLKNLEVFTAPGFPVLAGLSRKSMINKVIGSNPVTSLNGTSVVNTIALLNGASVLRVHDVKEACQAITLVGYYKNV
jgi:dihydropteroate synthase